MAAKEDQIERYSHPSGPFAAKDGCVGHDRARWQGLDVRGMNVRPKREWFGDWVLNGTKTFYPLARSCGFVIVLWCKQAKTTPAARAPKKRINNLLGRPRHAGFTIRDGLQISVAPFGYQRT